MIAKKKPCKGDCGGGYLYSSGYCLPCYKKKFPEKFQLKKSDKQIKKQTAKNAAKRKEARKDFPEFFQRHIQKIKDEGICCENCGHYIASTSCSANVCHILGKTENKHPETATNDLNVLYLCSWMNGNGNNDCHSMFDSSLSARKEMPVFKIAVERYKQFKDEVINYSKEVEQLEKYAE